MKLILNQLRIEEGVILSPLRRLKTQEELLVTEKEQEEKRVSDRPEAGNRDC